MATPATRALLMAPPEPPEMPANPQIVRLGTIAACSISTLRASRELQHLSPGRPTLNRCATTVTVVQRVGLHYAPAHDGAGPALQRADKFSDECIDEVKIMFRWVALLLGLFMTTSALAVPKPGFPRLALYAIGGPHNYDDPSRQALFAKFDLVILNVWPNWESGRSQNMEQVVRGIKARNPSTMVFLYLFNNEFDDANNSWPELRGQLDKNGWWLYANGGSGSRVKSTYGTSHWIVNNTNLSAVDAATGQRFPEWMARHAVSKFYQPNPSIDGFFLDNVFWKPRVEGDWNRDGRIDSSSDPTVQRWMRQGLRQHFDTMRALMPGKLQLANVADWGASEADLTEFRGGVDGGVLEGILGQSWSTESWAGCQEMMRWYRRSIGAMTNAKLLVFSHHGNPYDLREFRYGFASCLLDDGYYNFSPGEEYYTVNWFDEFDVNLGQALSPPSTAAWKNGVYRRDFERGIVLVNPKGNGPVDLELEADYKRIAGTQDRAVNNGQTGRLVRLEDRDGIVLLRLQARAVPTPPANLRVE